MLWEAHNLIDCTGFIEDESFIKKLKEVYFNFPQQKENNSNGIEIIDPSKFEEILQNDLYARLILVYNIPLGKIFVTKYETLNDEDKREVLYRGSFHILKIIDKIKSKQEYFLEGIFPEEKFEGLLKLNTEKDIPKFVRCQLFRNKIIKELSLFGYNPEQTRCININIITGKITNFDYYENFKTSRKLHIDQDSVIPLLKRIYFKNINTFIPDISLPFTREKDVVEDIAEENDNEVVIVVNNSLVPEETISQEEETYRIIRLCGDQEFLLPGFYSKMVEAQKAILETRDFDSTFDIVVVKKTFGIKYSLYDINEKVR